MVCFYFQVQSICYEHQPRESKRNEPQMLIIYIKICATYIWCGNESSVGIYFMWVGEWLVPNSYPFAQKSVFVMIAK